jgi:hypothetical protein
MMFTMLKISGVLAHPALSRWKRENYIHFTKNKTTGFAQSIFIDDKTFHCFPLSQRERAG